MSRAVVASPPGPAELFDGFPYLSVDFGEGVAHVVPLPASATRHELQRLAFEQVLAWRRPFALVFGEDAALLFDENGGSVRAGRAPRSFWTLTGRLAGDAGSADADVSVRSGRLAAFSARGRP